MFHLGEHHLFSGVRSFGNNNQLNELHEDISKAFHETRIYDVLHLMDNYFGDHNYSFWHLFKDDQREIMEIVMSHHLRKVKGVLKGLYENYYSILGVYHQLSIPVPKTFETPVELALNDRLAQLLEVENTNPEELQRVFKAMQRIEVRPDIVTLNYLVDLKIAKLMSNLKEVPDDISYIDYIRNLLNVLKSGNLNPEYRLAQNTAFRIRQQLYPAKSSTDSKTDKKWCAMFDKLYTSLNLVP